MASEAPSAGGTANTDPLVLQLGTNLLRFRSILTSAGQVGKVEVRGWDVATKNALTATEAAATTRIELPTVTPQALAKTFGDPTYVATDVPYRTQAEVDEAAKALADELGNAFAEFEGTARGNPEAARGSRSDHRRARRAVRREVHDHHIAASLRSTDRTTRRHSR